MPQLLRPRARLVSRMVRGADAVWVSTPALAATLAELRDDVRVVENGLDERLWTRGAAAAPRQGPVRILFMGTATHDADFAIVEGALARLKSVFGEHVAVDLLGVSSRADLPSWVNRIGMPVQRHVVVSRLRQLDHAAALGHRHRAARRYAVQSLQVGDQGVWTMRRWACRCWPRTATVYRGTLADGPGGWLVPDDEDAWFVALARLVRDARLRHRLADGARTAFAAGTLAAQAAGAAPHGLAWCGRSNDRRSRPSGRGSRHHDTVPGRNRWRPDRLNDATAPPEETAMIKIRNLAALLALSGVAVLPACSMFGGDSSSRSSRASYSSQGYAAAPNYNSTSQAPAAPN